MPTPYLEATVDLPEAGATRAQFYDWLRGARATSQFVDDSTLKVSAGGRIYVAAVPLAAVVDLAAALAAKQASNVWLDRVSGLSALAQGFLEVDTGVLSVRTYTAHGVNFLNRVDAAASRAHIGLGPATAVADPATDSNADLKTAVDAILARLRTLNLIAT